MYLYMGGWVHRGDAGVSACQSMLGVSDQSAGQHSEAKGQGGLRVREEDGSI